MAILKQITTNAGFSANYHKVVKVNDAEKRIYLEVYRDQDAKKSGKCPAKEVTYIMKEADYNEGLLLKEGNSPKRLAYTFLKKLPEYEGSKDV